ncbi:hypothetical protein EJ06DRAFT_558445 [Trichodelitschia bisporula]|uniref:DUF8035 domain-containing protein n=1 Tax=Trichodelitschia bisporula TaxID=703511 RepID=A0A6G1HPQ3_9PEZI|nr:hypothetical protein EJ06DRAFT_558445 [Trichodelitschia bisporula]
MTTSRLKSYHATSPHFSGKRTLAQLRASAAISCHTCTGSFAAATIPLKMDSRHYRSSSPGSRKLAIPGRSSTGGFGPAYDPYYTSSYSRSPVDDYATPRSAVLERGSGLMPLPSNLHVPPPSSSIRSASTSRSASTDIYSGRPRRSTLTGADGRSRVPAAVPGRPSSPLARTYVEPIKGSSSGGRGHRKVYSIDDGKTARLIEDRDLDPRSSRSYVPSDRDRDYGRAPYRPPPPPVRSEVDETGYSYTDPAAMYKDTEPRWRAPQGSLDGSSRRRPTSVIDPYGPNPRSSARELGPPPTTRGFDKIPDISRAPGHHYEPSGNRKGSYDTYRNGEPYDLPVRSSAAPRASVPPPREHYDPRDARDTRPPTRQFTDDAVQQRGFGIRPDLFVPPADAPLPPPPPRSTATAPPSTMVPYVSDTPVDIPNPNDYLPHVAGDDRRHDDRHERDYDRVRERELERGLDVDREPAHREHRGSDAKRDRERAYEDERERGSDRKDKAEIDPDEDYRRRVRQQELELARRSDEPDAEREVRHRERGPRESDEFEWHERERPIVAQELVHEPDEIVKFEEKVPEKSETRVRIVEPPKTDTASPDPPLKGILRKPTEKFPEHPDPIREGVAPLKDAKKSKDIPKDARWTKVDRRLVNPDALREKGERFEERLDCVIVLRVLTKEEIQKFADRTREIRAERYDRENREHRHRRRHHDDDDDERDRRHRHDYSSDEEGDRRHRRSRDDD